MKSYSSGSVTLAWSSNPAYCGPDGPLVGHCDAGIFNWTQPNAGSETLHIYDPEKPKDLVVGFERLCKELPILSFPNITYWLAGFLPSALQGMIISFL